MTEYNFRPYKPPNIGELISRGLKEAKKRREARGIPEYYKGEKVKLRKK